MSREEYDQIDEELKRIEEIPDDELTERDINRHTELLNRITYIP